MDETQIVSGTPLGEDWLTLEEMAAVCTVEPEWIAHHADEGLLPEAQWVQGHWRFSGASLLRARRMRQMERDFDAVPELAALVADLLEEMDELRARLPGCP